jgi:hypothetical protein
MHTWGLGIEHEMRVRFQHNINILDLKQHYVQKISKKFKYIPNYLFINSNLLYNYYRKYCNYIIDDYYKKHYNAHQKLKLNKKSNIKKKKIIILFIKFIMKLVLIQIQLPIFNIVQLMT